MEKSELISVIMPVYNAEKYLKDSIEDILAQTYKALEIILIDDGSTDGSLEILNQYKSKDERIKVIVSSNKGPSAARNLGLDEAKGKYIRFVDADDRIPKDSMEKLVQPYIQYQDIDLVIGNYACTPNKNYMTGDLFKEGIAKQEEFIYDFVRYIKSFYFGVPWNKLYQRDMIEKKELRFDESIMWCEDLLFNIEYFEECSKIYRVNIQGGIYHYIERQSSITKDLDSNEKINIQQIERLRYARAMEYCSKNGMGEMLRLEWKYSNLYGKLSKIAKRELGESLEDSYCEFMLLIKNQEVYQFVCNRCDEKTPGIWKWLKYLMDLKCYKIIFLIFFFKGCMVKNMKNVSGKLKKHFEDKLPKIL